MSRYRFALRPKWILSHLFVLALVLAMIWAAFWQLRRLDEKKDRNRRLVGRTEQPAAAVQSLIGPGDVDRASAVEFRRVTATGTYRADQQVLIRSRSNDGSPGSWVVAPLQLADGDVVAVNRGWIPNDGRLDRLPSAYRELPTGTVTVDGVARVGETKGRFSSSDPTTGTLANLARVDLPRLDRQVPGRLLPVYVQLADQQPAGSGAQPRPVPLPEPDEGPHLSYAIQWFIFTAIALVGYPLILRRRAREIERGDEEPEDDGTVPGWDQADRDDRDRVDPPVGDDPSAGPSPVRPTSSSPT